MEISLIEQETFLLYMTLFIIFFICCMLIAAGVQLYSYVSRIEKERDRLLELLGRPLPPKESIPENSTVLEESVQQSISKLKETFVKINTRLEQPRRGFVIFEKVDFDT
jgi:hypothetical protein